MIGGTCPNASKSSDKHRDRYERATSVRRVALVRGEVKRLSSICAPMKNAGFTRK
jgi:hypothetical protein